MAEKRQANTLLLRPVAAMIIPGLLLAFGFFLPEHIYYSYVLEKDAIFLNFEAVFFVLLCMVSFCVGVSASQNVKIPSFRIKSKKFVLNQLIYLAIPLAVAAVAAAAYFIELCRHIAVFHLIFMPGGGTIIKMEILESNVGLQGANQFVTAILWWVWSEQLKLKTKKTFYMAAFSSIVFCLLMVLEAGRGYMMAFLIGSFIVFLNSRRVNGLGRRQISLLLEYSGFGILLFIVFVAFSYLRGNTTNTLVFQNFLGYGPASFNRLALVLNGNLQYAYASTGYFLLEMSHVPFTKNLIQVLFGFPDTLTEYNSEFLSMFHAGLNPNYQWSTFFGYVFASIGLLSVLYFFFYGMFAGLLFNLFKRQRVSGVIFYPLMFVSINLWFTFNIFFFWFFDFLFAFIFISLYLALFKNGPDWRKFSSVVNLKTGMP